VSPAGEDRSDRWPALCCTWYDTAPTSTRPRAATRTARCPRSTGRSSARSRPASVTPEHRTWTPPSTSSWPHPAGSQRLSAALAL